MKKVNLCCGEDVKKGWLNFDYNPIDKRVSFIDLKSFPYPFKINSISIILISSSLEHFYKEMQIKIVNECYKYLKNDGKLIITLPTFLPYLSHKTICHYDNYLDGFIIQKQIGKYLNQKSFSTIKVTGKRTNSWGWRLKKRLFTFLYDEYEYILTK